MDDVTRNRVEMFDSGKQWFSDHDTLVQSNLMLKDTKTTFLSEHALLNTDIGAQAGFEDEGHEQTQVKAASRTDGVVIAKKVHNAALAAEPTHPGIQERYPYPRNLNVEDLIALLRSFVIGGNTDEDVIKAAGAPTDWIAQCTNIADAIEAAAAAQASAKDSSVGKNAAILARVDFMMQLINTAGYIIQNIAADDIEMLNSWHSASHVKQPPKKKDKPPTP